jgi:putative tricarboxylic transport membrane protein
MRRPHDNRAGYFVQPRVCSSLILGGTIVHFRAISSMQPESQRDNAESGPATWIVDAAVAFAMACIGAVVMFSSIKLGAGWGDDGPRSGYFPFYIGLFIVGSSLANLFLALRSGRDTRVFVEHSKLRLVLAVLIPSVAYVIAIGFLGIYVASALFIGAFMRWQGKFAWAKVAMVSVGVSICLFLMFEVWFKVSLPKGPLEALLGF